MQHPILIIEDDPDIAEGLKYNLERDGLPVVMAATGEAGLTAALDDHNPPSLIILDLMLPGMSGTDLCRRLRREPATRRTPIIMLTARGAASDAAFGLKLGADDYIPKPFDVNELLARIEAVLRRAKRSQTGKEIFRIGNVELDLPLHFRRDSRRLLPVLVRHHFHQRDGRDLPTDAKLVVDPATGDFLAAILQQRFPEAIDFSLVAAAHTERDGVVEWIVLAGAHREERLAKQSEVHTHHRAGGAGR